MQIFSGFEAFRPKLLNMQLQINGVASSEHLQQKGQKEQITEEGDYLAIKQQLTKVHIISYLKFKSI